MTSAKPSASIVASAIVAIIGSLLVMLIAGLGVLGTLLVKTGTTPVPQPPGVRTTSMVILGVFGAFGILGISSAVGIWRLQNWARLSFLIYSVVLVLMCVVGLAVVWLILPSLPNAQQQAATFLRLFIVIMYGLPAAIGVWWLFLFTRKDIARQFQAEPLMMEDGVTPVPVKPSCPLPIAILAGFSLFSACCFPILLVLPTPKLLMFFGHLISGRPVIAFYALISITLGACGIGLLQLRRWSYPLTIGYHLFFSASAVVTLLTPNAWTTSSEMLNRLRTPGYPGSVFNYSRIPFMAISGVGVAIAIAILVMVLYYRSEFYEQSDRKRNWNSSASLPPATSPTAPPALAP